MMRLTFLGTGTSTGIPVLRCHCEACTSVDPRDRRRRCAAFLEADGRNILIDSGPDIRAQLLGIGSPDIDAVLITHTHYDHLGGIDDLRPYTYGRPGDEPLPVYARADVIGDLRARIPYAFGPHPYPGTPRLELREVKDDRVFSAAGLETVPLPVLHGKLHILGYRIGPLAYITDASSVPQLTIERLEGVDTLVVNALRREPHFAHFSVDDALALVDAVKPRRTYLTHFAHHIGLHAALAESLPPGVAPAYDGLSITI